MLLCHISSLALLCCHEIFNGIVFSKPFLFMDTGILDYFSPRPVDCHFFLIEFHFTLFLKYFSFYLYSTPRLIASMFLWTSLITSKLMSHESLT